MSSQASETIVYHFPPELTLLLVDTIPLLCKSKRDVLLFFKGAGIPSRYLENLQDQVRSKESVNKFQMVRSVLEAINSAGDPLIACRREVLKRVTEWEDFSTCWADDQLKAKGLVTEVRRVVGVKDSFTRMNLEREHERLQRVEAARVQAEEVRRKQLEIDGVRRDLTDCFLIENPAERGHRLESVLTRLFKTYDLSIREPFTVRTEDGKILEQIDGAIEYEGNIYLVEMKWWAEKLGPGDIAQHLVRVFNRGYSRGLFIAAGGFTPAAIESCRESLQRTVFSLCTLQEIVLLLEQQKDLRTLLRAKIQAAILDKNPLCQPLLAG
ncbi:MAG: restriction endonuclease [SAR202 cluster bacterium]|nr:restriction endonuclease [SAR202 cluster bacterium]